MRWFGRQGFVPHMHRVSSRVQRKGVWQAH